MDLLTPRKWRLWVSILVAHACASGQAAQEYELKAAFLYNFTRFIDWPGAGASGPFCIGVLGQDPFRGALEAAVKGRSANGRSLIIRHFKSIGDADGCEILFIASSEQKKLRSILQSLDGAAVLTVGDTPEFCRNGGILGFELADEKVRMEINLDAAQRAHLRVSSKLLSLATVLHEGQQ